MIARFKLFAAAALGLALVSGLATSASAKTGTHRAAVHATANTSAKLGRVHVARGRHFGKVHHAGKVHLVSTTPRLGTKHVVAKHVVARHVAARHVLAKHVMAKHVMANRTAAQVPVKQVGKPAAQGQTLAHRATGKTSVIR